MATLAETIRPQADRARQGNDPSRAFRRDVVRGLSMVRKAIPARWFYDRRGSELFEDITRLDDYYPTRAETSILREYGAEIGAQMGMGRAVVEFGSGSSVKTPLLLRHCAPAAYVPIDISGDFLRDSAQELARRFPDVLVSPVEADFMQPVRMPDAVHSMPKAGFFPGSTIGNMVPEVAVDLLRSMHTTLGEGARLVIGMDRVKEESRLCRAYDDSEGVTAAFNCNLLERINRELDGTIPVEVFAHEARWNAGWSRIEMHLVARRDVTFSVDGQTFALTEGESIHTENSHKYTPAQARLLLQSAGWAPLGEWSDPAGDFMVMLAQAQHRPSAP